MSHEPDSDSLYGAAWDQLTRHYGDDPTKSQTPVHGLEKAAPALAVQQPLTGFVTAPQWPPMVQLGPHAAGGSLRQRAAAWLVSRTGIQTLAVSFGVPSIVWATAEVSAAQSQLWTAGTGVALVSGGMVLGAFSLERKFGVGATLTGVGMLTAGFQTVLSASPSLWAGCVGWLLSVGASAGARVAYANGRKEPDAKVRILENQARLIDAKTATEMYKAQAQVMKVQAQAVKAQLDQLKLAQALAAAQPQAVTGPDLRGGSREEEALRRAFWDVFQEELMSCEVTPTLSGWKAVMGLAKMSRDQARTGWDKVQSALRSDGRFVVSQGRYTNELLVKFISSQAQEGAYTAWDQRRTPADPQLMSLGIDTETGEEVKVQFDERLLITGASGTGKSWSTRPLLAQAHARGELLFLDGKGEEANIWYGICRTASDPSEIIDAVNYAHAVMMDRKTEMRERRLSVWDGEQLTVNVDEGQVVLSILNGLKKGRAEMVQKTVEISSLGRSRGVVMWWQTQYGMTSGNAPGIHPLIAANMLQRFSLRVADSTHARVALDDCAYYEPQLIPDHRSFRGHGYLKGYGPSIIRTWTMDDEAVTLLEPKAPEEMDGDDDPWAVTVQLSPAERAARLLDADPQLSKRAAADAVGIPEATLRRHLKLITGGQ